ncbi:MAG: hypothetical protein ACJA0Z_003069 [Halioglobus sp.]|jgi:hypothetical protein
MDWTTIGAAPPTIIGPIFTDLVILRGIGKIKRLIGS